MIKARLSCTLCKNYAAVTDREWDTPMWCIRPQYSFREPRGLCRKTFCPILQSSFAKQSPRMPSERKWIGISAKAAHGRHTRPKASRLIKGQCMIENPATSFYHVALSNIPAATPYVSCVDRRATTKKAMFEGRIAGCSFFTVVDLWARSGLDQHCVRLDVDCLCSRNHPELDRSDGRLS